MTTFEVSTMVASRTRAGMVVIAVSEQGRETVTTQLDLGAAREIGTQIIEAAESARLEAMVLRFALEEVGLDQQAAGSLLGKFRQYRDQERGEK